MHTAQLKCNQCGNMNGPEDRKCSLCDEPLWDERDERRRVNAAWTLCGGLMCTGLFVLFPGHLLSKHYLTSDPTLFWVSYLFLWCIYVLCARLTAPRDARWFEWLDMQSRDEQEAPSPVRRSLWRSSTLSPRVLLFPAHLVWMFWSELRYGFKDMGR